MCVFEEEGRREGRGGEREERERREGEEEGRRGREKGIDIDSGHNEAIII